MKKSILLGSVASLLLGTTLHGQVTTPTNLSPAAGTPFLGWSGAGPGGPRDLDIRNNYNLPIKFFTNGNNERMRITPTGLVSISNGLNAPLSLLHVNSNGNTIGGELFRTSGPANQTNACII